MAVDVFRHPEHPERACIKLAQAVGRTIDTVFVNSITDRVEDGTLSRESYAVRVQKTSVLTHEKHRRYINVYPRRKNAAERKIHEIL